MFDDKFRHGDAETTVCQAVVRASPCPCLAKGYGLMRYRWMILIATIALAACSAPTATPRPIGPTATERPFPTFGPTRTRTPTRTPPATATQPPTATLVSVAPAETPTPIPAA